jgi:DNA-3-methyladenine glycosylase II
MAEVREFTIVPDGAFSLAEAANFGFGPHMARPRPGEDTASRPGMPLAFTVDGFREQVGVFVEQDLESGVLTARVYGEADLDSVKAQVARVLSLDASGREWEAVGQRDAVLGRLQASYPGLRPVLFYSPYEAAAWAVISQRRHRSQAAALRKRLSEQYGRTFELSGGPLEAFPLPETILTITGFPSIESERLDRLHGVARAALDGRLDPKLLLSLSPEVALEHLQQLKGVGPMYAGLILLRSTGATDIATLEEPRIAPYVQHFYRLDHLPSRTELKTITDAWRPFRTWASVLIRVAGEREEVPWR